MVAVGGNALILDGQQGTIREQVENARVTARHISSLVADGWRVVVTHGNGPQVGFILRRSELIGDGHLEGTFVPPLSLDMCVADSQGGLGYIVGNALAAELARIGPSHRTVCVLTRTVVDADDPAFNAPTKPIGGAVGAAAAELYRTRDGWTMVEEAGRGYRRVVPSPAPRAVLETEAIRLLLEAGFTVVACGGGGIPVVEREPGAYEGVEAVVDKDLASALLAANLGVPVLAISTGVEKVAVRYRQPDQAWLGRVTVSQLKRYAAAGEFPAGSMGPKIRAAVDFIERGGQEVVISSPECLGDALAGRTGTHVVPG